MRDGGQCLPGGKGLRARWRVRRAAVLVALLLAGGLWAEDTHVVRRGETLTGIARREGVTVEGLARHNGIGAQSRLRVGQRLRIPRPAAVPLPVALSKEVREALECAEVQPGRWKHIVIHHSAMRSGSAREMDAYHRQERHMTNGLAYHFVIGNGRGMRDGEVAVGGRWVGQWAGGHLCSEALNQVSLGICLVGDFEKDRPTTAQLRSLTLLVDALRKRCGVTADHVTTHQRISPVYTLCPGRNFPTPQFLRMVAARSRGETAEGAGGR